MLKSFVLDKNLMDHPVYLKNPEKGIKGTLHEITSFFARSYSPIIVRILSSRGLLFHLGVVAVAPRDIAVLFAGVVAASGGVRCAAHQDRAARQQEQLLHYPAQHQRPKQRGGTQQL